MVKKANLFFILIVKHEKNVTGINTFTAGVVFCKPSRYADDEFIRRAEATSKMPMTYILVKSYPFKNPDDEITRHFYFTSYFHPSCSAFYDFSNIFASSIEVILAVTFWRCEKHYVRSRKKKHGFSRIISRICQHLKL